jgi:hypothetical protein
VAVRRGVAPAHQGPGVSRDQFLDFEVRGGRLREELPEIVRNFPAFYTAFDLEDSDALWLDEDQRVKIW